MKTAILLLFFALASCSKDNQPEDTTLKLPPETQIGANTFGCYINGNLLIPRDGTGDFSGPDKGAILWGDPTGDQQYSEIEIKDYKSEHTAKILIHIQSLNQFGVANYIIDESNGMANIDGFQHTYMHCKIFNINTNSYQYYRSFNKSGMLKITKYDFIPSQKLIISGVFSGQLKNTANSNDIIQVTQGRFDLNGATLSNKIFP